MHRKAFAAGILIGLLATTAASAATFAEQSRACRGDALRLCRASMPNHAKITACMERKLSQLSPNCRVMFQ